MHRSFNYRKGKGASVPNAQPTTARWSFPSLLPAHDLNCNDNRNGLTTIRRNSGGLRGSYHSDDSSRFFMEVSVLGEQSGRGKKKLLSSASELSIPDQKVGSDDDAEDRKRAELLVTARTIAW